MNEMILGLFGTALGLGAFLLGYELERRRGRARHGGETEPETLRDRQLEEMEEEQRAFRALTGYSADIAYGRAMFPGGDEE